MKPIEMLRDVLVTAVVAAGLVGLAVTGRGCDQDKHGAMVECAKHGGSYIPTGSGQCIFGGVTK